jgi:hypothetical protein
MTRNIEEVFLPYRYAKKSRVMLCFNIVICTVISLSAHINKMKRP